MIEKKKFYIDGKWVDPISKDILDVFLFVLESFLQYKSCHLHHPILY